MRFAFGDGVEAKFALHHAYSLWHAKQEGVVDQQFAICGVEGSFFAADLDTGVVDSPSFASEEEALEWLKGSITQEGFEYDIWTKISPDMVNRLR